MTAFGYRFRGPFSALFYIIRGIKNAILSGIQFAIQEDRQRGVEQLPQSVNPPKVIWRDGTADLRAIGLLSD